MINSLNFRNYVDCEARQMDLRKHLRELKDIKHFITSYRRKYLKNNKKTKYGEQIVLFTMSNIKKRKNITSKPLLWTSQYPLWYVGCTYYGTCKSATVHNRDTIHFRAYFIESNSIKFYKILKNSKNSTKTFIEFLEFSRILQNFIEFDSIKQALIHFTYIS